MAITETLLPEFDQEIANTRKTLERIPDDKFSWKPHEKSMTLGNLAIHLANLPSWTVQTLERDSLDIAPPGAPPARTEPPKSRSEVLEKFDKYAAEARTALAAAKDEQLRKPWSLLSNGQTIFTLPRIAVLRSFVINHMIHHRAQLGVYLRLNNVPVPAIYGPSADEAKF
jgi:uncharacterized damage-inducible protein DinB